MNLTVSPHARQQAQAKNIALAAVWAVARNPQTTYASAKYRCQRCGADQQRWTGEAHGTKLCLAVNACCGVVVTVWLDQVETDLRDDQRAAGVTGYRGRDGEWRGEGGGDARPPARRKPLTAKQRKAKKKARHAARLANEQTRKDAK